MALPGVGSLSVSNFIVGFVAMGLLLALLAYPIVHLFSAIMPHHLPVRSLRMRRLTRKREKTRPVETPSQGQP